MNQVFVDSSAWLAIVDASHHQHKEATQVFLSLIRRCDTFVTSADALAETYARLQQTAGEELATTLRRTMTSAQQQGVLQVVPVSAEISRKAWDIFERHHDRLTSLQHCANSVIAGRLGIRDVFSFASDYSNLGFRVWPQRLPDDDGDDGDLQK